MCYMPQYRNVSADVWMATVEARKLRLAAEAKAGKTKVNEAVREAKERVVAEDRKLREEMGKENDGYSLLHPFHPFSPPAYREDAPCLPQDLRDQVETLMDSPGGSTSPSEPPSASSPDWASPSSSSDYYNSSGSSSYDSSPSYDSSSSSSSSGFD